MTRDEIDKIYNEAWVLENATLKQTLKRINMLAKYGAYTTCVATRNADLCDDLYQELKDLGFDVDYYNDSSTVLEITWG